MIRRNVKKQKRISKKIFTVKIQAIAAMMIITTLIAIPTPALCIPADIPMMAMITMIMTIRIKINSIKPNQANYKEKKIMERKQ